ncbi:hypothetical protein GCM10020367_15360 [Streptomyces sannanensis]|uniref:SWIM-type domain-containing protein n=1 Tax=Streptomyces sannanensis TaxID=285536 RepID=A0ABP6S7P6_9ACTN
MSPRGSRGHQADDRVRAFDPLPPRPRSRGPFAESWWGNAWVEALEETSLDPGRLGRGRTYARGGHVGTITVTPGRIAAPVSGSRPRPYRSGVRLRVLTDDEWDHFLDTVAERPEHIAALLDKDMPYALADAAEGAGVQLLPGASDLIPDCSCPDWGYPCKHAAALCYQAARLLDADPFVLLLMRGRGERELLTELHRRNAALAARAAREEPAASQVRPGVAARAALAVRDRPPLPDPLPVPGKPGPPPLLPDLPGAGQPQGPAFLALDTAVRAHAFLTAGTELFPGSDAWTDAVRLAATHPRFAGRGGLTTQFRALAAAVGRKPLDLTRAVAAWHQGGAEGLAVLETTWSPPADVLDRTRTELAAADLPQMSASHNRITDSWRTRQLRYGHDGRWYPYRAVARGDWWPQGPPDHDPVGALLSLYET